jgi:hypothetical protein
VALNLHWFLPSHGDGRSVDGRAGVARDTVRTTRRAVEVGYLALIALNIVTGGDPDEQRRYGHWLDHDARYARTDEFLTVDVFLMWGDRPPQLAELIERVRVLAADLIAKTQQRFSRTESVGQRRMAALHGGRTENIEVYPNLWAGYGLVRQGAGTALVGSYDAELVADSSPDSRQGAAIGGER